MRPTEPLLETELTRSRSSSWGHARARFVETELTRSRSSSRGRARVRFVETELSRARVDIHRAYALPPRQAIDPKPVIVLEGLNLELVVVHLATNLEIGVEVTQAGP